MPIINYNGGNQSVSWTFVEAAANGLGITINNFMHRHGIGVSPHTIPYTGPVAVSPQPQTNGWQTTGPQQVANMQTTITQLQTDAQLQQAIAQAQIQVLMDEVVPSEDDWLSIPAPQHDDFQQIFGTTKARASKPMADNTGKLLQEVYKYKAMSLRKTDSVAYEKANKVEKPFEWATMQGMIGIEIEVENIRNSVPLAAYWDMKEDGSLRNHGKEFVSVPLQIKQVQLALEHLYTNLLKTNAPDFSNRTSTHIHVNCRDLTQDQIFNFVLLYAIFEKHFFQVAGTRRMNSIFCVPLFRTNQMSTLNEVIYSCSPNWHKYCGINLLPLFQNSVTQGYGTIEFRHLYGTKDVNEILHWINDIMCLRKFACEISKEDLLKNIESMNTTSSYMSLYSQVFAKGRRLLSNKKDFEECVSNIKRELFGNDYVSTIRKSDSSPYWELSHELGLRG